jgi:hypothetical protein
MDDDETCPICGDIEGYYLYNCPLCDDIWSGDDPFLQEGPQSCGCSGEDIDVESGWVECCICNRESE